MSIAEVLATTRRLGCYLCGEKPVAVVQVMIRELDDHGAVKGGPGVAKYRQRSLCEQHAVEAWSVCVAALEVTPAAPRPFGNDGRRILSKKAPAARKPT